MASNIRTYVTMRQASKKALLAAALPMLAIALLVLMIAPQPAHANWGSAVTQWFNHGSSHSGGSSHSSSITSSSSTSSGSSSSGSSVQYNNRPSGRVMGDWRKARATFYGIDHDWWTIHEVSAGMAARQEHEASCTVTSQAQWLSVLLMGSTQVQHVHEVKHTYNGLAAM